MQEQLNIKHPTTNSLTSLMYSIACDSRDWSVNPLDAWIFGIVCGWGESLGEVALKHNWELTTVKTLMELHEHFNGQKNSGK